MLSAPRRFETLALGSVDLGGMELDARIVASAGAFHVLLMGTLGGPEVSLVAAKAAAERDTPGVTWRADLIAGPDEDPCPICRSPVQRWERHPRAICVACVLEAADEQGRGLRLANVDSSGGFRATLEDGVEVDGHVCFVRGVRCWADESRFGGIIVEVAGER